MFTFIPWDKRFFYGAVIRFKINVKLSCSWRVSGCKKNNVMVKNGQKFSYLSEKQNTVVIFSGGGRGGQEKIKPSKRNCKK